MITCINVCPAICGKGVFVNILSNCIFRGPGLCLTLISYTYISIQFYVGDVHINLIETLKAVSFQHSNSLKMCIINSAYHWLWECKWHRLLVANICCHQTALVHTWHNKIFLTWTFQVQLCHLFHVYIHTLVLYLRKWYKQISFIKPS